MEHFPVFEITIIMLHFALGNGSLQCVLPLMVALYDAC